MSGYSALTVKTPKGEEYRVCALTKFVSFFLNNLKTINEDPDHIKKVFEGFDDYVPEKYHLALPKDSMNSLKRDE
jgi:hypothetical protein